MPLYSWLRSRWFSAVILFLVALVCTFTLAHPIAAQRGFSPQQVLTMGTSTDYPPFEYHDRQLGQDQIIGFDLALATELSKRLGFELKVQDLAFTDLIPALQMGKLDFAMAALTPTVERQAKVAFSRVYFESRNTILALKAKQIRNSQDLAGKKVGVQAGTVQQGLAQELSQRISNLTIVPFDRVNDLINAIEAGQIDAAIIEDVIAEVYVEEQPKLGFYIMQEVAPVQVAIAFPKNSGWVSQFDRVLHQMDLSGDLKRLIRQWFALQ